MSYELLHGIVEQNAELYPGEIAVREEHTEITYSNLNLYANSIAHTMAEAGLKQADIVGVLMPPGIRWVAAMLGIFKSGMIYLPLSKVWPVKKINEVFQYTGMKWLILAKEWEEEGKALLQKNQVSNIGLVIIDNNAGIVVETPGKNEVITVNKYIPYGNPSRQINPHDGSYIIYTSGSTGSGKAILGCHAGLAHFVQWQIKEFLLKDNCRVSQLTSMVFDASFRDVFLPLAAGGTLYIPSEETRTDSNLLVSWLEENEITLVHCVPSVFRMLTRQLQNEERAAPRFKKLSLVFIAGEPLYTKDVLNWRAVAGDHIELVNMYGTSETTMAKTFYRVKELPHDMSEVLPVGRPIENAVVAIISNSRICRIGELGEIYIKTPYWTKGYFNNDELNRKIFVQNPLIKHREDLVYKTGDLGRYKSDQSIEIVGRIDDQVKINGLRVELNEIEQAVLRMPGINEAVVKVRQNEDNQNELVCYYTNIAIPGKEVRDFLSHELHESLMPSYFISLPEFPLTLNGKVDRKALPEPEIVLSKEREYEQPLNITELVVETIWKEVLNREQIGRNESFFLIGGNSLKAIQVISRISKEFDVLIKIVEIFNNQTIAQLSRLIDQTRKSTTENIPALPEREFYDLSHAQKRLWMLYQREPESYAYNIPEAFWVEGEVDWELIRKAFDVLVQRHEVLRTNFISDNGTPRQKIHPAEIATSQVELKDISNLPGKEEQLKGLLREAASRPFDLEKDKLLQVKIFKLEPGRHVFFLNIHHIISDSWSREIIMSELLKLYYGMKKEQPVTLPPLRIQYKDFAAWQNMKVQLPSSDVHKQFWIQHLDGNIQDTELPVDFSRPKIRTAEGSVLSKELPAEVSEAVAGLNTGFANSSFATLFAAIRVLLYRLTNQPAIIIGTPWTSRRHADLENQLGFYVSTLPLLTPVYETDTFARVLENVKQTIAEAEKHQDYPFDKLLEDSKVRRKSNRMALFDVGFSWHNDAGFINTDLDFSITPFPLNFSGIKADLWFHGYAENEKLNVSLEYSSDLFKQSTAYVLLNKLEKILLQAGKQPGILIKDIALDMPEEVALVDNTASIEFNF